MLQGEKVLVAGATGQVALPLTRMHELAGHATVPWREGFARMVAARRARATARSTA
jgi:hypothetical protein